jgi:hypothetical protein
VAGESVLHPAYNILTSGCNRWDLEYSPRCQVSTIKYEKGIQWGAFQGWACSFNQFSNAWLEFSKRCCSFGDSEAKSHNKKFSMWFFAPKTWRIQDRYGRPSFQVTNAMLAEVLEGKTNIIWLGGLM